MSKKTLFEMMRGGADKAIEAGATLAGGHTIEDDVPKYGLCVTGTVHPDKALKNVGARPGDILLLTKPIGTGILATAMKAGLQSEESYKEMVFHMAALNDKASAIAVEAGGVHACTDVTGFGLLGHGYEMASGSGVTVTLWADRIPLLRDARSFAEMGIIPAGAYRNMDFVKPHFQAGDGVPLALQDLISDPQTSGGLLFAVDPAAADGLLSALREKLPWAAAVGVVEEQSGDIFVRLV